MNIDRCIIVFLLIIFTVGNVVGNTIPPNIVFVMTDQQTANAMSCVQGSTFLSTPNMDSLAVRGVRFLRAYSPNPLCMPARASIFTGHYPHETGFQTNNSKIPPPPFNGMATYFRKAGYQTYYFGKWHLAYAQKDVDSHGFTYVINKSSEPKIGHDANVTNAATQILKEKQHSPFLAVVSYLNPHDICQYPRGEKFPSGPIGEIPPLDQCPPTPVNWLPAQNETDSVAFIRKAQQSLSQFPVGNYGEDDWRRLRWVYYRLIEKVDSELGKILQTLHDSGNDENTIIVFTSDHGECAGSHGFNQKTVFYEESVNVPLIIVPLRWNKGETNTQLINTGIDIIPTFLDYAGIPIPEELPGKSLRSLIEKKDTVWNRDYLVIQNHMNQTGEINGIRPSIEGRLVVTDNFKYVVYSQGLRRESLYDLKNDPGETRNIVSVPEFKTVLKTNRSRLQDFAERQSDSLAIRLLENNVVPIPIMHFATPFTQKKNNQ
jgi:choline-sulfatase